ncbi:MAG: MoaD/ThiS family protein [Reichenbachiella sp.]
MLIKVIAFGIARDILGGNEITMEIDSNKTVDSALKLIIHKYPEFGKLSSLRMAVNESYVENDYSIKEGDELVLIPPVSGG